ncbi:unnamed protein product [Diplocarpon coronariae]
MSQRCSSTGEVLTQLDNEHAQTDGFLFSVSAQAVPACRSALSRRTCQTNRRAAESSCSALVPSSGVGLIFRDLEGYASDGRRGWVRFSSRRSLGTEEVLGVLTSHRPSREAFGDDSRVQDLRGSMKPRKLDEKEASSSVGRVWTEFAVRKSGERPSANAIGRTASQHSNGDWRSRTPEDFVRCVGTHALDVASASSAEHSSRPKTVSLQFPGHPPFKTAPVFTCFSKLPLELRYWIWVHVFDGTHSISTSVFKRVASSNVPPKTRERLPETHRSGWNLEPRSDVLLRFSGWPEIVKSSKDRCLPSSTLD